MPLWEGDYDEHGGGWRGKEEGEVEKADLLPTYAEVAQQEEGESVGAKRVQRHRRRRSRILAALLLIGLVCFYVASSSCLSRGRHHRHHHHHHRVKHHGHHSGRWRWRKGGGRGPFDGDSSSKDSLNVILMISDGYGPAGETLARSFLQAQAGNTSPDAHFRLPLDKLLVGTHRSRSSDSLITDSAAGATAFACGVKSYNGAIGVDTSGQACGTWFEAAKQKGWLAGVVVTTRLTDATPASFISHVLERGSEGAIADQVIRGPKGLQGPVLDVAIGGGGCYFLPNTHPLSCRVDEVDLIEEAQRNGWDARVEFEPAAVASLVGVDAVSDEATRKTNGHHHLPLGAPNNSSSSIYPSIYRAQAEESTSKPHLPFLRLLAPSNLPFDIDRQQLPETRRPPSLKETAAQALDLLSAGVSKARSVVSTSKHPKGSKGFVLMIEGSQIDLGAHFNDPATHAREALAYQETVEYVRKWVDKANKRGDRTLLISTSDHETGGLTLGRQLTPEYPNYAYYPSHLLTAKHSTTYLSAKLLFAYRSKPSSGWSDEGLSDLIRTEILGAPGAGFIEAGGGGDPLEWEVDAVKHCLALPDEARHLARAATPQESTASWSMMTPPIDPHDHCRQIISDLASRRAEIGWSTSGHTGVDINVYADGHAEDISGFRGNIENTDIANEIAKLLHVDLEEITKLLRRS